MAWDEDRLHQWLARRAAPAILVGSPGHDACVLRRPRGREVVCTDQVILGVHCELDAPAQAVGRKAAQRALSDLAATAAVPRGLMLAVRASRAVDERVIRGWIQGVERAGRVCGAELVGGDIACAEGPASLCVTALGEYLGRGKPPGRDRARVGDWILLTGAVGGSLSGRHLRIEARLAAGRRLHHVHGARALMDVSDGLAWDLYRMMRSSGVGAHIEDLPIHRDARLAARADGRDALSHALHDGEDHELIAVLPRANALRALADTAHELRGLARIGRVVAGRGVVLDGALTGGADEEWSPADGGWRHGG